MKLIKNIDDGNKEIVINAIKKFGSQPEHHFPHFLNMEDKGKTKCMFFHFDDETGFMVHKHKTGLWEFLVEPLAPKEKRLKVAAEVLDYVLNLPDTYKALVEFTPELRKALIKFNNEDRNKWIIRRPCYIYHWPVYDLKEWDPELKGKKWKKLRHKINLLKRDNDVKVVDSRTVDKKELMRIFDEWSEKRNDDDFIEHAHYHNAIENGFKGYDFARTVVVNNVPRTITAGWQIGDTGYYYSSFGVSDYSMEGLGEYSNYDDLTHLKNSGMKFADFGGSDKALLEFKMKFRPCKIYKTFLFYVVKNQPI